MSDNLSTIVHFREVHRIFFPSRHSTSFLMLTSQFLPESATFQALSVLRAQKEADVLAQRSTTRAAGAFVIRRHTGLLHEKMLTRGVYPAAAGLEASGCGCCGAGGRSRCGSSCLHLCFQLLLDLHRLYRCDADGVGDVWDSAPPAQVVDRLEQALHHRPHRDGARRLLHGLVRVVAGVL